MVRNERSGGMEQAGGVSELNVFRAVFFAYVERRTDLLHLFLGMKRPQTLELRVNMVFPDSDYVTSALTQSGDNLVFNHKVLGAEMLRSL